MLTKSSEYALRAANYLARQTSGEPVAAGQIAAATGIQHQYLSKILSDLVRAGVFSGAPGRNGGFKLAKPANEIQLIEILTPFEPPIGAQRSCPFGNDICSDEKPCSGHHRWREVREAYSRFVHETTVADVAFEASPLNVTPNVMAGINHE